MKKEKVVNKRGGDRGYRKPIIDEYGHKWCNCTIPNLISRALVRGTAYCAKCKCDYYH